MRIEFANDDFTPPKGWTIDYLGHTNHPNLDFEDPEWISISGCIGNVILFSNTEGYSAAASDKHSLTQAIKKAVAYMRMYDAGKISKTV